MLDNKFDVIIIGAGVAGCCVVRELCRWNLKVLVLEACDDIANGSTRANSGIVHAGYDPKPGTNKAKYNVEGSKAYPRWANELNFPYENNASLVLAFSNEEMQAVCDLYERGIENGVERLSIIDRDKVLKLEPKVSPKVQGALFAESGGICDPYQVALAAIENAVNNGAKVLLNHSVKEIGISKNYDMWECTCEDGSTYKANSLINAAGVFSDEINNMVSEDKFTITPRKGEYILYDTHIGDSFKRTLFQTPTAVGKGILVSPTIHGNLFVGPNSISQESKTDKSTVLYDLNNIVAQAKKTWPKASMLGAITNFAGLRSTGDRGDFVIGQADDAPGFFNIACFDSPGLTSAPAVAEDISTQVAEYLKADKNKNFDSYREKVPNFRELSSDEQRDLIERDAAWGRIICRCQNVTEAEILTAIHSPVPGTNIDAIKWRTRAGMGRCQSGFCMPVIAEIIARETGIDYAGVSKRGGGSELTYDCNLSQHKYGMAYDSKFKFDKNVGVENQDIDIVIIGGGAAGLSTALGAWEAGARDVLIVDREARPGGILKQCIHSGFGLARFKEELTGPEYAQRDIDAVAKTGVKLWHDSSVIDLGRDTADSLYHIVTVVTADKGVIQLRAKAVCLAMGSRERTRGALSVAGTRPAGLYTAGTAQAFMNLKGQIPGNKIIISGSGDIGLIMARRLALQGAIVEAVLARSAFAGGLRRNIVQCLEDFDIPILYSTSVTKVHGDNRVEGVTVCDTDVKTKLPIPGTERFMECDTLLISAGLIAENELSTNAGLLLDSKTGGIVVDEKFQSEIPGIFSAGNVLHVHDIVDLVSEEGLMAGASAYEYVKNFGRHEPETDFIKVCDGENVNGCVPQRINKTAFGKLKVAFRVCKVLRNATISVLVKGNEVASRKSMILVPAEMASIQFDARKIAGANDIVVQVQGASQPDKELQGESAKIIDEHGSMKMVCVACPMGCSLKAIVDPDTGNISVEGNTCKRGITYAKAEVTRPERMISCLVKLGGSLEPLSCRTAAPISKSDIYNVANALKGIELTGHFRVGDVVVKNICDTGVDIISTKNL
ncbi:MAG: FAD-dependent oxidoreductase [Eggerthellaceae bacterium]|nr:FAD-dependent oxidoreductase [Eggerthellaceae bacterium]